MDETMDEENGSGEKKSTRSKTTGKTSKKTTSSKAEGNPFVALYQEHLEALRQAQQDATDKLVASTTEYYEALRGLAQKAEEQNPWPAYLAETVRSLQTGDQQLLEQANRRLSSHLGAAQTRVLQQYAKSVRDYIEALQQLGQEAQEEMVEKVETYVSSVRRAIADADAADLDRSAAAVLNHSLLLNAALVERERAET